MIGTAVSNTNQGDAMTTARTEQIIAAYQDAVLKYADDFDMIVAAIKVRAN